MILLTPTPILTSSMNIYDLIYFIDETALLDPERNGTRPTVPGTYYGAKKLNTLQRELKQRVQALFFDDLRLEQALDEQIAT